MLYLAGIVITLFLAILLAAKHKKSRADNILLVWLCFIAFHLFLFYLFISGRNFDYPALLGIHPPYPLIHGPLLFLYIAELTGQQPKYRFAWTLHFLPVIIIYLVLIPFFNLSTAEKIEIYRNKGAGYEGLMNICFYAIIFSGIAYVIASLQLLHRYRKSLIEKFSNIEKINLAWLQYLVYGIAVIWTAVILGNDSLVFAIVVLFVFCLGFFGIRQVGIFTSPALNNHLSFSHPQGISIRPETSFNQQELLNDENKQLATPKLKYEKSGLDEEKAGKIHQRLVGYMTQEKIFTESELTLGALAKTLDVHPNHLSQVINSYDGKNFYDYINYHRVEEFKRLAPLPDNRNYTLLSLAYECGFNSKTSFNRNFKKATGVSPLEYLHQQNISLK